MRLRSNTQCVKKKEKPKSVPNGSVCCAHYTIDRMCFILPLSLRRLSRQHIYVLKPFMIRLHAKPTPKINRLCGTHSERERERWHRRTRNEMKKKEKIKRNSSMMKIKFVSIIGAQTTSYRLICWFLSTLI